MEFYAAPARFSAPRLHLVRMTPIEILDAFAPGALVLLASIARAEAQVRTFVRRGCETAACRNRRLSGLCALLGMAYGYAVGSDSWLQCASWINTACSVATALASGVVRRASTDALKKNEDKRNG